MDVSVIIVNYNTLHTTAACIERILEITHGIDFEIIVVDNASVDGSREYFISDRRIRYIYNHENIGFGRANNLGLKIARGRNILFLNPDTLPVNNAVAILCQYLDQHNDVAAVGGNLYDEQMQPALSFRRQRPSILWELNHLLCFLPERLCFPRRWYFNFVGRPIRVGYITGADLMARHDALFQIDGFASEYFMYYEDTDLCQRLKQFGNIVSVPDARIQHLEGGSFEHGPLNHRRIILSEQGRHIYYRRNHSRRHHFVSNIIYMLALRLHSLIYRWRHCNLRYKDCKIRLKIVKALQRTIFQAR